MSEGLPNRERAAQRQADLLFGFPILLSAFLLFSSEPMAAKELLPAFGGSSAVWITALLFFQVDLLLGYQYARMLVRLPEDKARRLHLLVLAAAALAVCFAVARQNPAGSDAEAHEPTLAVLLRLGARIGLPFLVLASTSPLLQVWHSRASGGPLPYRWFGLSNLASLAALLAYPTLLEPYLSLHWQRVGWTAGFLLFAGMGTLLTVRVRQPPGLEAIVPANSAPLRSKLLWFLLPLAGTLQLSAVTAHLTVNVAAMPLLWTLPLAAYLLSFTLAFDRPAWYRRGVVVRFLVVLLASLAYLLSKTDVALPLRLAIVFFVLEVFVACFFLHAETFRLRPQGARESTLFYVVMAAGGATGTLFVAVISPLLFASDFDLPIAFLATAALALTVTWDEGWGQRLLWGTGVVLLAALLAMLHIAGQRQALLHARNFYGTLRVKQTVTERGFPVRTLLHGSIQHGTEIFDGTVPPAPTTYYAPESGIGLLLRAPSRAGVGRSIGVVGLGTGTVAAYGRAGDRFTFYELNPLVPPIAQSLFTYLRSSAAEVRVVEGDARASLNRSQEQFDVLAIDAFSGDAIPVHLLTVQAMATYVAHLRPGGLIAFHVSNQYVDLAPEIVRLADSQHLRALAVSNAADAATGAFAATWVVVGTADRMGAVPELVERSHAVPGTRSPPLWTDDYSSLLPLLR